MGSTLTKIGIYGVLPAYLLTKLLLAWATSMGL